jgi:hypothetical protein
MMSSHYFLVNIQKAKERNIHFFYESTILDRFSNISTKLKIFLIYFFDKYTSLRSEVD